MEKSRTENCLNVPVLVAAFCGTFQKYIRHTQRLQWIFDVANIFLDMGGGLLSLYFKLSFCQENQRYLFFHDASVIFSVPTTAFLLYILISSN